MSELMTFALEDDGTFPSNPLPVILYPQAIDPADDDPARSFEELFRANGWGGNWRNGIFDYHHYHATAHEVLGCARGWVQVLLGGPKGREVRLQAGDIVLLPAGTAHRNLRHSSDYLIVGAYPPGQRPDMKYGEPEEYESAKASIAQVPMPDQDPVFGSFDGVLKEWP
jgi:uncharacterized protein YjlB